MRNVGVALGTVAVGGPVHVVLIIVNGLRFVIARWEVNIGTERRSIAVAVLIWEAYTCSSVSWVLNAGSVETIRVHRVQWLVGVRARTRKLDWGRGTTTLIEN